MRLTVILFDGYTALDIVGGYEVLARVPGMEVEMAAHERGLVASDTRALGLVAYRALHEIESTDILYVPGGPGVEQAVADAELLACIRRLHASSSWTIGICNGVGLLAAAGILEGKTVTTNWSYREALASRCISVVSSRFHRDGNIVTGAGVSASIDAALYLAGLIAGEEVAKIIQLGIEYYPSPPFGGTSAEDAPPYMQAMVRSYQRASADGLAGLARAF